VRAPVHQRGARPNVRRAIRDAQRGGRHNSARSKSPFGASTDVKLGGREIIFFCGKPRGGFFGALVMSATGKKQKEQERLVAGLRVDVFSSSGTSSVSPGFSRYRHCG